MLTDENGSFAPFAKNAAAIASVTKNNRYFLFSRVTAKSELKAKTGKMINNGLRNEIFPKIFSGQLGCNHDKA